MKSSFSLSILLFTILSCAKPVTEYGLNINKHRFKYKQEFKHDERAPLHTEKELDDMDFFRPNEKYVVNCDFEEDVSKEEFEMNTYSGMIKPYYMYGLAKCQINGKRVDLEIYKSKRLDDIPEYKDYLFLPFKDETNDNSTYGGGRYIDLRESEVIDGKIMIDFNKAYNPWCAYSDGYNCPIPPAHNHLQISIEAGEKKYKGEKKKMQ